MAFEPADPMADPWLLGIEIGGTKLQLGIGHGKGSIRALERLRVEPSGGAEGVLGQIQSALPALLHSAGLDPDEIEAVGIGFGGPVDTACGRTITSYQVAGWEQFPLARWVCDHLGIPQVVLENDSDSAGLAEARFGAGLGRSPVLYTNIGSGIGGALIVDGHIYRGCGQGALEIGHLGVVAETPEGPRLAELEQVASGWAIARSAQIEAERVRKEGRNWSVLAQALGQPNQITAELVAKAAQAGDDFAASILGRARSAVAFALTQTIALLAPSRIVLGGGVSLIDDALWLDPIRQLVNQNVFEPFRGHFEIVPAALGEEVVVHGALALARDAVSPTPC
ncbi:MAG: ROK family protein [Isosphaeraceae bacterium]